MDEATKLGRDEATKASVLEVALTHHLVSPYTSLVAVDVTPARPDVTGSDKGQAINRTSRQDLGSLPKTATGWQLQIMLGLASLLLAAGLRRWRKTAV
jgi:Ca-activated chloride channel family protein